MISYVLCGCGGTGRRARLRIWCPRRAGSIPVTRTKKEVTFVYQKLLLFLSKPQGWYIIAARSAVHIIKVGKPTLYLITRQRAFSCGLMRYNASHWWYAATSCGWYTRLRLDYRQKYDIMFLKRGGPFENSRCEKRMVKTILGAIQEALLPYLYEFAYNDQGIKDRQLKFRGSKRLWFFFRWHLYDRKHQIYLDRVFMYLLR